MEPKDSFKDYPPLLEPGLHELTREELRRLCVEGFRDSTTRLGIMNQLENVLQEMEDAGLPAEVWVNASFLTEMLDPEDVDIVVLFEAGIMDSGPRVQRDILRWLDSNLREELRVDSYLLPIHTQYGTLTRDTLRLVEYWKGQYGFTRSGNAKGIAFIRTRRLKNDLY